jgi:putative glycosyltransferase (exosortase G-associated)
MVWGVWVIVPVFIDGFTTLVNLVGVLVIQIQRFFQKSKNLEFFPFITIIVPVYNSASTIEACIDSLLKQEYPANRVEILLIDNGSTDNSYDIFSRIQYEKNANLRWHAIINQGKSWALNAGIHMAQGEYILNVDSDVVLRPDAVRQIIAAMEAHPEFGAVTGAIEVLPPDEDAPALIRVIAECEFFEYLTAFNVGRAQQTLLQNLYTLSGAFTAFRREVLLSTYLYNQDTITEDTDLTFEIYERIRERQIGCVTAAVAYVHPIESLSALYAQRVRWQRGQLEVSARHEQLLRKPIWKFLGFSPKRVLVVDHTLSFPRLVWTFFLPALTLYGYSLSMIFAGWIILYGFYLLIDLVWILVAMLGTGDSERFRLRKTFYLLPILPLYRMMIFWFRFSGFLLAIAEPGKWRVADPISQIRRAVDDLRLKSLVILKRHA